MTEQWPRTHTQKKMYELWAFQKIVAIKILGYRHDTRDISEAEYMLHLPKCHENQLFNMCLNIQSLFSFCIFKNIYNWTKVNVV